MRGGNIVVRHGQNFGLGFRRADQSVKFWCGVNAPSVLRALRRGGLARRPCRVRERDIARCIGSETVQRG
jgi:hypothetical protein